MGTTLHSFRHGPGRRRCARMLRGILFLFAFLPWFATAQDADAPLFPVRLAMQWLPQSQFAGFYMAREKGFYADVGLDVDILHTGPGPSSLDYLEKGKADFATTFLADAVIAAGRGGDVVHVGQFFQRSSLMLVAWRDMGIEQAADLHEARVSFWQGAFSGSFRAFFRQHGIQPEPVPQHYTVTLFLERGVAACAAMHYNEYYRIYLAGIDPDRLTVFPMHEYGLGFPEDGLYTRAAMAENHPDVCRAVREATLRGWAYAREHPEETLDIVLHESRSAGVPANRPHARWMLRHVLDVVFCADSDAAPGMLDPAEYKRAADSLSAAGMTGSPPSFEAFTRMQKEQP